MVKKYSALDLFGGKKEVFSKMVSRVRNSLEKLLKQDENSINEWFELCGFDEEPTKSMIYGFAKGKQKINYDTLCMLGQHLDININGILTNPKFTTKSKKYWLNQIDIEKEDLTSYLKKNL